MFTSNKTIKWIENLAEQECLIQLGEKSSVDLCTVKDEVLSNETNSFVRALFYHFEYLIKLFNSRVDAPFLKISVQNQSENFNTFSLNRNGMSLVINGSQSGSIQLRCFREGGIEFGVDSVVFSGTIEARFETFHEVKWYFLDSQILPEQVARHYITEFLQVSRSQHTH
jgi:hypothetical protein